MAQAGDWTCTFTATRATGDVMARGPRQLLWFPCVGQFPSFHRTEAHNGHWPLFNCPSKVYDRILFFLCGAYIQWNIPQPHTKKKEGNNALCSNMEEIIILSKSDRERQISYDITYMWNLKKRYQWTYLQNRNRLTDLKTHLWLSKGTEQQGGPSDHTPEDPRGRASSMSSQPR